MSYYSDELNRLKENNNFREIKKIDKLEDKYLIINGKKYLDMSSSNYLGLRDSEELKQAAIEAIEKYGIGSGASRLVCGTADVFEKLEKKLSELKNQEKAIFFNSGYDANIGIISSLVDKNDVIFCDKLNHASIYDGIKLSGANLIRYKHNDIVDLEKKLGKFRNQFKKALIVTDTVFSMDGDKAKLKEIVNLKKKYDVLLMIDEAHAGGVLGENGAGLAEEQGVLEDVDINMGTFSKAYGGQGGYAAGSKELVEFIINKGRSLIYTTALPPMIAAANLKAVEISEIEKERKQKLDNIKTYLLEKLCDLGYNVGDTETQIIPIIFETNKEVLELSKKLFERGIFVAAIRRPTVVKPRLRISLGAHLCYSDIDEFLEALRS